MKNYCNFKSSSIAVCFIILIQLMAFECRVHIPCPANIPKECNCISKPMLSFSCTKDNERILLAERSRKEGFSEDYLDLNCTTISDDRIFQSINLTRENSPGLKKGKLQLTVNLCPLSVLSMIGKSTISLIDPIKMEIRVNNLTTLPEELFQSQTRLSTVELTGHQLTNLPENTFIQPISEELSIFGDELTTLPEQIFRNQSNLKSLNLNGKRLATLPDDIFINLTRLEWLYIEGNNSLTLPNQALKGLKNLQTIIVSGLKTSQNILPENFFKGLKNIKSIDFSTNNLTTLPENIFEDQTNMTLLFLEECQLISLPENIFKNQINMKQLYLQNNQLTTLPENIFRYQTKLFVLHLDGNLLTTLPENLFKGLTELTILYLSGNQLTKLSENIFQSQSTFNKLSLDGNRLTTLPGNLSFVRDMNLTGNQLTTLPMNILNSEIKDVPVQYMLRGNPWSCNEDFVQFAQELKDNIDYNEIKCGDGELLRNKK